MTLKISTYPKSIDTNKDWTLDTNELKNFENYLKNLEQKLKNININKKELNTSIKQLNTLRDLDKIQTLINWRKIKLLNAHLKILDIAKYLEIKQELVKIQSELTDLYNDILARRDVKVSIDTNFKNLDEILENLSEEEKENEPFIWLLTYKILTSWNTEYFNKFKNLIENKQINIFLWLPYLENLSLSKAQIKNLEELIDIWLNNWLFKEYFYYNENYPFWKILYKLWIEKNLIVKTLTEEAKILSHKRSYKIEIFIDNLNSFKWIFNKNDFYNILLTISKNKAWVELFTMLDILKNFNLDKNQLFVLLYEAAKNKSAWKFILHYKQDFINLNFTPEQYTQILKEALKNKLYVLIYFPESMRFLNQLHLNTEQKIEIFNEIFWLKWKDSFKESFFNHYKEKPLTIFKIPLWKNFEEYQKDFTTKQAFQKFVEKIIKSLSEYISEGINSIYDFAEIDNLPYWNENNPPWAKTIIWQIKKELKRFSTEELISSLGNHSINYSTTFKLILAEIHERIKQYWYKNIFQFIDNDKNINDKTKIFLKWQVIAWLSARGKINELNNLLQDEKNFSLIDKIIDYKNNNIFNLETYLWLAIWLPKLLEKNTKLQKYIYKNYFEQNKNIKFKTALQIAFAIYNKKLTSNWILPLKENETNPIFQKIRKQFLLPTKEIFQRKIKDLVYIYWWDGEWWWLVYYKYELNIYKNKYWYKTIEKWPGYEIIEKNWIEITFINYDKSPNSKEIFSKYKINPILFAFRWHNFVTSEMIREYKNILNQFPESIILDWGCRNVSKISTYRKLWIENQIMAYTSTWKWNATFQFLERFISQFLRHPEKYKNKNITLKELSQQILPDSAYTKNFMKFPGDLIDIILEIEKWSLKI